MIQIFAVRNYLKTCNAPYVARSSCSDAVELDELIDTMAGGRTTLTKPDITGCLQLFVEEVVKLVADGKHVKTPLGAYYLSASGKMETKNQPFTPGEGTHDHAFTLHFRTNKSVEAEIKSKARWERIENVDMSAAVIDRIFVVGAASGESAHPGSTVKLEGRRMKFDPADNTCGLFLENGTESVRVTAYPDIAPSKLIAILPADLAIGTYDLVLVTKANGKDAKEGYLDEPLVVA